MGDAIIRKRALLARLAISDTTLWRLRRDDPTFPRAVRVSPAVLGWRESQITAWLESRQAGDLTHRTAAANAARTAPAAA